MINVTIGFLLNAIIKINLTMKCLKEQRTYGSVFLALRMFYLSKQTFTAPVKLFHYTKLFQLKVH